MESGDADWNSFDAGGGVKEEVDSSSGVRPKMESSNSLDNQPEPMYDSSNLGGDDDYMSNLGLYDGYDSYNDSGGTTEDDERYNVPTPTPTPTRITPSPAQASKAAALQKKNFRFLNGKDGMATCEQCGSMGVRHAFYSKSKRFCSLSCSRSFATAQREGKSVDNPTPAKKSKLCGGGGRKSKSQEKGGGKQETKDFEWGTYLLANNVPAAPVACFPHVPMSDSWDQIAVGMKVEVANMDCDLPYPVFWIASVERVAGFTALMRYEGFGGDPSHDFWVNLVSPGVHPVGWCATLGKPLVPPQSIQNKYADWKEFLVKRLTGSRTLPSDFHQMFHEGVNSHKLRAGMKVEVVNKIGVSTMKVAVICQVVGGRLRLNYIDSKDEGDEFWCHMKSPLIHYVGWSSSVGHMLEASKEYRSSCLTKVTTQKFDEDDVSPDMMPKVKDLPPNLCFSEGMKLEAIDPLNLSSICVATVMKVLRRNYLMIGIDGSPMVEGGSDWFCYHAASPCIFPVGFCEVNNIELTPPKGYKGTFKWFDYLKQNRCVAAPVKLFDKEIPKHGFKPGMKIEAVDLMEPRLICVATVTRIVGRLMRVHFDGWENEYDQWVDCQSPDIYPVGWCQAMDYTLEGPRIKDSIGPMTMVQKKKKARNQIYKGPRKKRKSKPGFAAGNNNTTTTTPAHTPVAPGYRLLGNGSSSQWDAKDSKYWATTPPGIGNRTGGVGVGVRPPHMPLPPEAVAANLPPLADPDLPEPSKRSKVEGDANSKDSPMDIVTSTPRPHRHPHSSSSPLPTLSPKGGNVPDDRKTTPHLLPGPTTQEGSSASSKDAVNNNSNNHRSSALTNGVASSSSSSKAGSAGNTTIAVEASSGSKGAGSKGGGGGGSSLLFTPSLQKRDPKQWSAQDVCLFLSVNDCGACSETVLRRNISGSDLLSLSPEEEISLAGTKVGPSLRITQLLQQLRAYVSAASASSSSSHITTTSSSSSSSSHTTTTSSSLSSSNATGPAAMETD